MKGDDIAERLLNFAVRIIRLIQALPRNVPGKQISTQLFRSGTSGGANYEEARGAESRADFIHKVSVAWKEIREATFWLKLIHRSAMVKPKLVENLLQEADELSRILARSLTTAKNRNPNDPPT